MTQTPEEKRRFPRLDAAVRVEVTYRKVEDENFSASKGTSRDISLGGVAFHHRERIEPRAYVAVKCHLPAVKQPVEFLARVVREEFIEDGKFLVCVEFLRFERQDIKLLEKYLKDFLEEGDKDEPGSS